MPERTTDAPWRVARWDERFENNRSRELLRLEWVPVPNRHDGKGYARLMVRADAAEVFAAWVLIVQVASRCPVRGVLADRDGRALDAHDLAATTRGRPEWFERAFEVLSDPRIGWLEPSIPAGQLNAATSAESAGVPEPLTGYSRDTKHNAARDNPRGNPAPPRGIRSPARGIPAPATPLPRDSRTFSPVPAGIPHPAAGNGITPVHISTRSRNDVDERPRAARSPAAAARLRESNLAGRLARLAAHLREFRIPTTHPRLRAWREAVLGQLDGMSTPEGAPAGAVAADTVRGIRRDLHELVVLEGGKGKGQLELFAAAGVADFDVDEILGPFAAEGGDR